MTSNLTTPKETSLPDLIEEAEETLVLDATLAKHLGYERPRALRDLIKRHAESLGAIGPLAVRHGKSRGQEFTAFYLNEAQAHFIVAKSETNLANSQLIHVSQVFTEFRRGNLVPKDTETQARLTGYQEAVGVRGMCHEEEKEARRIALRFLRRR